jgi:hypothetical protein
MYSLASVVAMFGCTVWDLAENHGELSRMTLNTAIHLFRTFGLA